ncbi:HNH endonuclease [Methylobacterium sp. WL19]|nr:HNH endonuclease [Methylobacterium sp. WL19]
MPPERAPCGRLRPPPKPTKAVPVPVLQPWDQYRFWTKVRKGDAGACWPWIGARSGFGYGRFKVGGKLYSPHRLIYAMECGPIKNAIGHHGSVVMHTCDNPACCNPAHLTLGTQQDNVTDMAVKGRGAWSDMPPMKRERTRLVSIICAAALRASLPSTLTGAR